MFTVIEAQSAGRCHSHSVVQVDFKAHAADTHRQKRDLSLKLISVSHRASTARLNHLRNAENSCLPSPGNTKHTLTTFNQQGVSLEVND